ncbi:MAG: GGDEF domain-containing protein [Pseudomonadaceae bacterium]|nr:GGDEF domain-containing protein [Pseudomonadaceae bacterium]
MPQLDIPSLLVSNVGVVLFCALLMFHSWWRGRHERTLLWAGVMLFLEGSGLLLNSLRGLGMDWLPLVVGNMVLLLCSGMTWVVMGAFCGRPPRWWLVTLGAWAWLLLCQWPAFYEDIRWRVTAFSLMLVGYMLAAMYELWRGRAAQPVSVLAALLLMGGHALLYVHRLAFATWGYPPGQLHSPMFAILLIESVLYAVGMAFLVLSMVKERAEQQFRVAAYSDPLTGIGNRRAFISAGERLLRQCAAQH